MEVSLALTSTVAMETIAMRIAPQARVWYKSGSPRMGSDRMA
jgi:hypothetical protein